MEEFARIKRLPPYVFNVTGELKLAARRRGEDIIDFSMGNPDQPTPRHIVDKLIESVQRTDTHGYSVSKGISRLRKAICNWYRPATAWNWIRNLRRSSPSVPRKASRTWHWQPWIGAISFWCPIRVTRSTSTVR